MLSINRSVTFICTREVITLLQARLSGFPILYPQSFNESVCYELTLSAIIRAACMQKFWRTARLLGLLRVLRNRIYIESYAFRRKLSKCNIATMNCCIYSRGKKRLENFRVQSRVQRSPISSLLDFFDSVDSVSFTVISVRVNPQSVNFRFERFFLEYMSEAGQLLWDLIRKRGLGICEDDVGGQLVVNSGKRECFTDIVSAQQDIRQHLQWID